MAQPADLPPRMGHLLLRLVVASFALATTALVLAGYCFTHHGGDPIVAGAALTSGGTAALALRLAVIL